MAKRQPGRHLQVYALYPYWGIAVVPDAPYTVAAQAVENTRLETAQKTQGFRGQKSHPGQLVIHVEKKPFAVSVTLQPSFEFADPPARLDRPNKTNQPWARQPKRSRKGSNPFERRTYYHAGATEPATARRSKDECRVEFALLHLPLYRTEVERL